MFVSGLGLYYSLEKDNRIIPFYIKRFKRIFPAYYLIGIFASLFLFHDNIQTYIFRFTTIGFWTGLPYYEWYIPSIVVLYIAAPYIKKIVTLTPFFFSFVLLLIITAFFLAKYQFIDMSYFFLIYRIPAFMLGMYIGQLIKNQSNTKAFWILLFIGIPFFVICFPIHHTIYEFKYFSLFFLLPSFILTFCLISKALGKYVFVMREIGNASLEIYLIQTLFFSAIIQGQLVIPSQWHDIIIVLLMIFCSVTGILAHRVLSFLIK